MASDQQLRIEVTELLRQQHVAPDAEVLKDCDVYGLYCALRILTELRDKTQGRSLALTLVLWVNGHTASVLSALEPLSQLMGLYVDHCVLCVPPAALASVMQVQATLSRAWWDRVVYWYWDRPVSCPTQLGSDGFCLAVTTPQGPDEAEVAWDFKHVLTVFRRR